MKICTLRNEICTLKNENLYYREMKSVLCEMKISKLTLRNEICTLRNEICTLRNEICPLRNENLYFARRKSDVLCEMELATFLKNFCEEASAKGTRYFPEKLLRGSFYEPSILLQIMTVTHFCFCLGIEQRGLRRYMFYFCFVCATIT